jgi:diguanylate cyclase
MGTLIRRLILRCASAGASIAAGVVSAGATAAKADGFSAVADRNLEMPTAAVAITALSALALVQWRRSLALRAQLTASQAQARQLASHDSLLGVPNRAFFRVALDESFANPGPSGVHGLLYIDLDRFKEVNDSYGHEAGDRLLLAFTRRMRAMLDKGDVFARLGGDEFAVLRHDVRDEDELELFANRLLAALDEPFDLGSHCLSATASIGCALGPEDSASQNEWAQRADFALHRAKQMGRARASVFERSMLADFRRRRVVKRDLAQAIATGAIEAYYQPIFDIDGMRIVSAEALLRWDHPEFGALPADLVVSIAEESGQIARLGEYMLRRACEDAARWDGLRVAVNVSAIQFRDRGFVEAVNRALAQTGLPGHRLELELTESVIVSDAELAEESMTRLRACGVRMALDDFGAGYSSLMYLRRFPFDKIKIDRSFVETIEAAGESAVLLSTIVELGHALGLRCVAEGVETAEQHRIAKKFGCEEVQGYLFAKPAPRGEFESLLATIPRANVEPLRARAVA